VIKFENEDLEKVFNRAVDRLENKGRKIFEKKHGRKATAKDVTVIRDDLMDEFEGEDFGMFFGMAGEGILPAGASIEECIQGYASSKEAVESLTRLKGLFTRIANEQIEEAALYLPKGSLEMLEAELETESLNVFMDVLIEDVKAQPSSPSL